MRRSHADAGQRFNFFFSGCCIINGRVPIALAKSGALKNGGMKLGEVDEEVIIQQ